MLVEIINQQRKEKVAKKEWKEFAISVLKALNLEEVEVSIVFVGDQKIKSLNKEFRGFDKPTDVLSFSYGVNEASQDSETNTLTLDGFSTKDDPNNALASFEGNYLGDVVISTQTATLYAKKLGLTFDQEIKILILHGLLHLSGYDHETDNGEMDELEQSLRKQLLGFTFPNVSIDS
jgi:probable rRNA maturation factor